MKRIISIAIALIMLTGTACAMPIQLTNGVATVDAFDLHDNVETELSLQSFHLLAQDPEDGSYLIYYGQELYTVQADAMAKAIVLTEEVPQLGELQPLTPGTRGEEVVPLQRRLWTLGYLTGSADGDYGAGTQAAVADFQTAAGLEATGEADEITQLLLASVMEDTIGMEAVIPPEVLYAPIIGKTSLDLQPILDSGLEFDYDDMSGEGFISGGEPVEVDASGSTALDKYTFSLQFGLLTRESEGAVDILPALKLRCLCVRRPVLTTVTMKAGEARGVAAVDELKVSLEGIDTVEEGIVLLTGDMIDALANAADAGELKLRVEGQYKTFDISLEELDAAARVGQLAREIAR